MVISIVTEATPEKISNSKIRNDRTRGRMDFMRKHSERWCGVVIPAVGAGAVAAVEYE